jgi:hypothetical protein
VVQLVVGKELSLGGCHSIFINDLRDAGIESGDIVRHTGGLVQIDSISE